MENGVLEEDDDIPQLSSETMAALQEFYKEQQDREQIIKNVDSQSNIVSFEENWQLSQFWYDDDTIKVLSNQAVKVAGSDGYIALISCPSLYQSIKNHPDFINGKVLLLEYDKRFSVYGSDFLLYDYNKPLEIPQYLQKSFDLVIADPPFLSEECLEKTSQTIKLLAKDKIILCSGSIMESLAGSLLNVKKTDFEPHHRNNLANVFYCYSNYQFNIKT